MRIITKGVLKSFWLKYPDAETELKQWYVDIIQNNFENSNQVIQYFNKADIVGNNRIVFNICYNKYRMVALFRYQIKIVYIRYLGTHKDYDKIKDIKNI